MNTLSSSVFIPLEIATRKKAKTYVTKASDEYALTPLSKLLVKAYILQQRLLESPGISQKEFCELNKISPRYLRGILQFNILSPEIKRRIMSGWMPKNISIERLQNGKIPLLWSEQEKIII